MTPKRFALFFFVVTALVACSVALEGAPCHSNDNCPSAQYCDAKGKCASGSRTPLALADGCNQMMTLYVTAAAACTHGPAEIYPVGIGEPAICASLANSVSAGRVTYDSSWLHECGLLFADAGCTDMANVQATLSLCPMFKAAQSLGKPCQSPLECAQGYCDTDLACPSACTDFVSNGGTCGPGARCGLGSTCVNGKCAAYTPEGQSCDSTHVCDPAIDFCFTVCTPRENVGPCASSDICAVGDLCAGPFLQQTCQTAIAEGQTCAPGYNQCSSFLYCDSPSAKCVATPLSGACGFIGTEWKGCQGGRCVLAPSSFSGTCQSFLSPGDSCSGTTSTDCGPTAHCGAASAVPDAGFLCQQDYCP